MKYFLGVDIGSISVKCALVDEKGQTCHLNSQKIISSPKVAVNSLLDELNQQYPLEEIVSAGVSGSGKAIIPHEFGWSEYSSSLALASGLLHGHPEAKSIIQIGGQSSLVIELEDGLKKPWKVVSNPLCAAGTGRFLEQQSYRLGIKIEDFAKLALSFDGSPPRIAARCSVFAKSDLIHLQQKGVSIEAMLCGLSESIARMVVSLKKGAFKEPVYFLGGVAANGAIVRALNRMLSERNGHPVEVRVPENFLHIEALGSAFLSMDKKSTVQKLPERAKSKEYMLLDKLEEVPLPGNLLKQKIEQERVGYLGVDVGSTSTKAVIMDETGKKILAKNYIMTAGRPVDAVKQVFANLLLENA
jgi:predicted CoA-substrate-specific enzyme activase